MLMIMLQSAPCEQKNLQLGQENMRKRCSHMLIDTWKEHSHCEYSKHSADRYASKCVNNLEY